MGLTHQAPTRLASLTIGGAHPYATNFGFYRQAFAHGIDAWIANIEHHHGPLSQSMRHHLHNNDSKALLALVTHDRPALWPNGFAPTVPLLLFAGSSDPLFPLIRRAALSTAAICFQPLEGLDHYALYLRSQRVVPLLVKQIASTSTTNRPIWRRY